MHAFLLHINAILPFRTIQKGTTNLLGGCTFRPKTKRNHTREWSYNATWRSFPLLSHGGELQMNAIHPLRMETARGNLLGGWTLRPKTKRDHIREWSYNATGRSITR